MQIARWAPDHIAPESRILWNDPMYFDRRIFPDQVRPGGLPRYIDLLNLAPDYFVLRDHRTSWIDLKRRTTNSEKWSDDPFSVRLFQDLIDRDPNPFQPGPTGVPGIDLVFVAETPPDSAPQAPFGATGLAARTLGVLGVSGLSNPLHCLCRLLIEQVPPPCERFLVYRVRPEFFDQPHPVRETQPADLVTKAAQTGPGTREKGRQ